MPAPVPPGYTRGPILFIGPTPANQSEAMLLQRFWSEAGGYGARLLLIATRAEQVHSSHLTALFHGWETEAVVLLPLYTRAAAQQADLLPIIEQATGLLLLENDPLHLTMRLGGTQAAQAIRRANARGKVVAGLGAGATALCQHMLLPDQPGQPPMAAGLGLVNRLGLVVSADAAEATTQQLITRLAYNPFLIGVGLGPDTGLVVYPDTTLEVFGQKAIQIVDGAEGADDLLPALSAPGGGAPAGWRIHQLTAGYTFNFDRRTVHAPPPSDIPLTSLPGANG